MHYGTILSLPIQNRPANQLAFFSLVTTLLSFFSSRERNHANHNSAPQPPHEQEGSHEFAMERPQATEYLKVKEKFINHQPKLFFFFTYVVKYQSALVKTTVFATLF